ncbi:MAG TPA: NAD(P)H-dependent glycerol-3-phosphate dehydrogenase [Chitinophagaceae bacterium]|nr:NAD(P)H-dependent glycerol-3-phosphate dehydrogenase [Chitinophagaceae bacterium]
MRIGVIGSGSWGTALVKLLTDNKHRVCWTVRNQKVVDHILNRHHNPNYLHSVHFDTSLLDLNADPKVTFEQSEAVLMVIPSAYMMETVDAIDPAILKGKKFISAVKGMVPGKNQLLNEYLKDKFGFPYEDYFTIMGPCHSEEVAAEKLSYLTFSGIDERYAQELASCFQGPNLNTVVNNDIFGVQYAAILKNIFALGAGIAHGLEYGDNFLSVFIANCADEMAGFLRMAGIANMEVGIHKQLASHKKSPNYAASVYLGDLLVTSYSLFSRNRTFGNMIGKGYSVKAAQLEMNMVAEGYNASRSIHELNQKFNADIPIADAIFEILWEGLEPKEGFKKIEAVLI